MAETEEVPFTSPDGAASALTICHEPCLQADAPALITMPAMGVRAGFYQALAEPFYEAGLRLVTCDLRGHGKSDQRPGGGVDFGYREMVELDWPAAVRTVRERLPEAPVVLLGHSLGGQVSLLYAATNPGAVDAVITVATCSVYWASFPIALRLPVLLATQFIAAAGAVLGSYPGHRLGFGGHEARRLVADWAFQARTGRYRAQGSDTNFEAALGALTTPCLLVTVAGDRFAPASAAAHLHAKLPAAVAERHHLADRRLRGAGNPHLGWVRRPKAVVETISAWLDKHGMRQEGPRAPADAANDLHR